MGNIFLVGMMGSGKTTTAKELAKLCQRPMVDLDRMIEANLGKSINDIFSQMGENVFRESEKQILKQVTQLNNQIVATGGGIILAPENVANMSESGQIIYLKTSFATLWSRVKRSSHRPLLKSDLPEENFKKLFDSRIPFYEKTTSISVVTDGKTPKQVAEELYRMLFHEKN